MGIKQTAYSKETNDFFEFFPTETTNRIGKDEYDE